MGKLRIVTTPLMWMINRLPAPILACKPVTSIVLIISTFHWIDQPEKARQVFEAFGCSVTPSATPQTLLWGAVRSLLSV